MIKFPRVHRGRLWCIIRDSSYDIPLEDLLEAEQLAAYVIYKYGDRYLPLYVRLREETSRK